MNIRKRSRKYYVYFSSCHGFVILCCDQSDTYNPEQGKMLQISYIKNIKTCPPAFSRTGSCSLAWLVPRIFGVRVISEKLIFAVLSTNVNRKTFCRSVDRNFAARHQTSWLGSHYAVAGQGVVSDGLEKEFALFRTNWINCSHLLHFPWSCVRDWITEIKGVEAFVASVLFCSTNISLKRKPFQESDLRECSDKGT